MTKQLIEEIKLLLNKVKSQEPKNKMAKDPSYMGLVDLVIEFEYFWQGIRKAKPECSHVKNNKTVLLDKGLENMEQEECPVIKLRKNKTVKQMGLK